MNPNDIRQLNYGHTDMVNSPMKKILEIRQASPDMEKEVYDFFQVLDQANEGELFYPHPLTQDQAHIISTHSGQDLYAFAMHIGKIIGYSLLRGWDEGYEIPSLGISVHPHFRGFGVGLALMHYLHAVASLRGCHRVRLRVRKTNHTAKQLYEKMGYTFTEGNDGYLVGFFELKDL